VRGVIRGHGKDKSYFVDGRQVSQDEFDSLVPDALSGTGRSGASLQSWQPILSDALAVHPDQVAEATLDAKRKGVPTEFMPDGRPILRTRQHRKEYLRAYGFHDNQGGYGD
jgi:hypothetical protein